MLIGAKKKKKKEVDIQMWWLDTIIISTQNNWWQEKLICILVTAIQPFKSDSRDSNHHGVLVYELKNPMMFVTLVNMMASWEVQNFDFWMICP